MITIAMGGAGAMITAVVHLGYVRSDPKDDHALARGLV
jgi:hypothetical protein